MEQRNEFSRIRGGQPPNRDPARTSRSRDQVAPTNRRAVPTERTRPCRQVCSPMPARYSRRAVDGSLCNPMFPLEREALFGSSWFLSEARNQPGIREITITESRKIFGDLMFGNTLLDTAMPHVEVELVFHEKPVLHSRFPGTTQYDACPTDRPPNFEPRSADDLHSTETCISPDR